MSALRAIEAAARRARDITQNLLRFSQQQQAPDLRPVDLNRVARDALGLSSGQLQTERVDLVLELAPELPEVEGDPGHLAQVLLNLVSNAVTAVRGRPTRRVQVSTRAGDDKVTLVVEDSGKGIAPEHLPRIFEPFFTTKDTWSNVGLGLSVAYRIVQEHGGAIHVETEVGRGTRATVDLPRRRAPQR